MNKTDEKEELTLQNVPRAVNYLINEIAEIRMSLNWGLELTSTGLSALKMPAGFWIRQKRDE